MDPAETKGRYSEAIYENFNLGEKMNKEIELKALETEKVILIEKIDSMEKVLRASIGLHMNRLEIEIYTKVLEDNLRMKKELLHGKTVYIKEPKKESFAEKAGNFFTFIGKGLCK